MDEAKTGLMRRPESPSGTLAPLRRDAGQIQREAEAIRNELDRLLAELDRRRKQLFGLPRFARKYVVPVLAGAAVLITVGSALRALFGGSSRRRPAERRRGWVH